MSALTFSNTGVETRDGRQMMTSQTVTVATVEEAFKRTVMDLSVMALIRNSDKLSILKSPMSELLILLFDC